MVGDVAAQLLPGAVNLCLDRADGQVQLVGDLLVRKLAEEPQFDQFPVARSHFAEEQFELCGILVCDHVFFRRGAVRGGQCAHRLPGPFDRDRIVAPATRKIDKGVAGDRVDPFAERMFRVVGMQFEEHFDERLLQQVVRVVHIAPRALDIELVTVEQMFESDGIPAENEFDELLVGCDDVFFYLHTALLGRSLRLSARKHSPRGEVKSYRI